ncbi:hypothetical protein, partial [Bacillus subtilis]|uniref:hypothetical protein n=1 Tax=Bacillus subtilis TaxID=1423 RepID=UPI003C1CE665
KTAKPDTTTTKNVEQGSERSNKSADVGGSEQAPKIPIKPKDDLAKFADNKIATADAIAAARARRAERLKNPTIKSSVLP